jgi:hypothetical protein
VSFTVEEELAAFCAELELDAGCFAPVGAGADFFAPAGAGADFGAWAFAAVNDKASRLKKSRSEKFFFMDGI